MKSLDAAVKKWLRDVLKCEFSASKHFFSNQDEVFKIATDQDTFYLKISDNLSNESENLKKLSAHLPVPKVRAFKTVHDKDCLLLTAIPGKNLAEYVGDWSNEDIVRRFAKAAKRFHSMKVYDVFPGAFVTGAVVVHGDLAMPNIIYDDNGLAGFIDMGQMTISTPDTDLADAIWSLQRNIGPGYGELFLQEYGPTPITDKIDEALKYRY
jgi:aminoglycoside phosphotransferase